jgi:predicted PurR-regulated permease PerM
LRADVEKEVGVLLQEYPVLNLTWTLFVIFAWAIWFSLLIWIFADIFRRDDTSGWAKAVWIVFLIVLPFIGVFAYLVTQSSGMARRNQMRTSQAQLDEYMRSEASASSPTSQVETAKQLLDSGAITKDEFQEIKRRAIGTV